ncbi:MAG TPA: hypothetical protein VFS59_01435 [Gemmatimonadaceae bacterium]|nr:hypothetical protein [Gemmatimonadaceae bacterium]
MITSALALLIALAGPSDTVRAVPDSAAAIRVDDALATMPARLALPVSLQVQEDTIPRRRRSIEVSDWYERRLRIHRYGAYATIPLFAFQAAAGNELYRKGDAADGWAKNGHRVGATALATVFGVNTVTGLWNLWDSRAVEQGRTRRTIHTLLMLASDAGFAYAGIKLSEDAEESSAARRRHRNTAYASMGVAVTGAGMMLLWRD